MLANITQDIFNQCVALVAKKKASGQWTSFNAVCCVHNGETADTRGRGGLLRTGQGGLIYSCFNCHYRTGWSPGAIPSKRFMNLLGWFGLSIEQTRNFYFQASKLRVLDDHQREEIVRTTSFNFNSAQLPNGARPFSYWLENQMSTDFLDVVDYMSNRGDTLLTAMDYYWTPEQENSLNKRVIVPFVWQQQVVGWTARAIFPTKYRYYSQVPKNFMFNTQNIKPHHSHILVAEGPFDALAVGGIAMLGNHMSKEQIAWLNDQGKKIVIVPDREKQGGPLVDVALQENWYVAFPRWEQGIKDAADASKAYGKLFTVWSILDTATNKKLEIGVRRQLDLKS